MTVLQGKGVWGGIAIGRAHVLRREGAPVARRTVEDPEREWARFVAARDVASAELLSLCEQARHDIGEGGASIFEIHAMMLEDEDYNRAIESTIRIERADAEYAVMTAADHFAAIFAAMNDPYMRARAADVRDISARVRRVLRGEHTGAIPSGTEPIILCADDLAPSETMQLDRDRIAAFVTAEGSINSHTAILARSLGIPAIVGVGDELASLNHNTPLAVDSFSGKIFVRPDKETVERLTHQRDEHLRARELLEKYRGMDNVTRDGQRIDLFANVQSIDEVGAARLCDAGGIGLFRSEFLYLDRESEPDEEEQFRAYRTVLQSMGSKKVIIRTLDAGADKQIPYFSLPPEENPALGLRGARLCLCRPHLLRTQLRALLRASVFGNLAIMFPMIVSVAEVSELLTLSRRVRAELETEGHPLAPHVEIGIMIETPAAALISHRLAPLVDFFSIGTNDLSQYALAIDRQNPAVLRFFDEHHEAVLRLIAMTVEAAHAAGKWVGICGELAGDSTLCETFLRMGVDELSVSPSRILELREHIRNLDLSAEKSKEEIYR